MSILKFLAYTLLFYFVFRIIGRLLNPSRATKKRQSTRPKKSETKIKEEKPKFNIEAETVDYEVIETNQQKTNL